MVRNGGTFQILEGLWQGAPPSTVVQQYDTFNCSHCDATVTLRAGMDPTHSGAILFPQPHWQSDEMGVCLMCADGWSRGLICPTCHKIQNLRGGCRNFEKRMDLYEKRERLRAQLLG